MLSTQNLKLLFQGGHGSIPVVSAAFDHQTRCLASLDQEGTLVIWDIYSAKQLADISLVDWDAYRKINAEQEDFEYTSKQIRREQIMPDRLQIHRIAEGDTFREMLFAYGKNAVFAFDLSNLYEKPLYPAWIRFLGQPKPARIEINMKGKDQAAEKDWTISYSEKSPKITLDTACGHGVLSAEKTHYLYKANATLNLVNLLDSSAKPLAFSEDVLSSAIESIVSYAYNEKTNRLAVIYRGENSKGKIVFYQRSNIETEEQSLKVEKSEPLMLPAWLSPEADAALWVQTSEEVVEGKKKTKRRFHRAEIKKETDFAAHQFGFGGDIFQINLIPGKKNDYLVVNTFHAIKVLTIKEDQITASYEIPHPKVRGNKFLPLAFSPGGDLMAVIPGWLKNEKEIRPSNGLLYLNDLEEGRLKAKVNFPRPQIVDIAATNQEQNINIFRPDGTIFSLELSGRLQLKNKYFSEGFRCDYKQALTCSQKNIVYLLDKKPIQGFKIVDSFSMRMHQIEDYVPENMALSEDGNQLVLIDTAGLIKVFDLQGSAPQEKREWHLLAQIKKWLPGHFPKSKKKLQVDKMAVHHQKKWLLVAYRPTPENWHLLHLIYIKNYDSDQPDLLEDRFFWLPYQKGFSLNFDPTGTYSVVQSAGKAKIYKPGEMELFRDPALEDKLIKITNEDPETLKLHREKRLVEGLAESLLDKTFSTSSSSPALLHSPSGHLIILERKDIRSVEVWKLDQLQAQITAHGPDRLAFTKAPDHVIDTTDIPYTTFLLMQTKPILIFYRKHDGWLKLFNWQTGELLLTVFPYDPRKFLLLDKNNYYFSGENGYDLAAFQQQDQLFPMEQFDLMFNRPDKVLSAMAGMGLLTADEEQLGNFEKAVEQRANKIVEERFKHLIELIPEEAPAGSLANIQTVLREKLLNDTFQLPKIELDYLKSSDKAAYCFYAQVKTAKREKLIRLNVFVNDVPLYGRNGVSLHWAGVAYHADQTELSMRKCNNLLKVSIAVEPKTEENKNEEELGLLFKFEIHLQLSPKDNKIQLAILNMDGIEAYQTFYVYNQKKYEPTLYFVGIAVDEHEHQTPAKNLDFPVKDMANLVQTLQELKDEEGFKNLEVSTLPDLQLDPLERPQPTLANMKTFLAGAKEKLKGKNVNVNDKVIVFYSGHGERKTGTGEDHQLVLSTTDMDFTEKNGLLYADLEDLLDVMIPRNKFMIIDACNSGEVDTGSAQNAANSKEKADVAEIFSLMKNTFVDLRRGTGATIISASLGDQNAKDSIFIKNLIAGISEGKRKISELIDDVSGKLPRAVVEEVFTKELAKHEELQPVLKKAILDLIALDLPKRTMRVEMGLILEKFIDQLDWERSDIHSKLINPIMRKLQQPTPRAINLSNDWSL